MTSDNEISYNYRIDPLEFAEEQHYLKGLLDLNKMLRLKTVCCENQPLGQAKIWVKGDVDQEGIACLSGEVVATLPLVCQRCLEIMNYVVRTEFALSPVHNDKEAQQLPSYYEPLYLSEKNTVVLSDMIEDELILSLPLVAKHDQKDCLIGE
jgi:uncharacterized protein